MRLLIVNFEMDAGSAVLAWQQQVARRLSTLAYEVVVVTEREVPGDWPANMTVRLLPLLPRRAPLRWAGGRILLNWWVYGLCRRHAVDACFVHMNVRRAWQLAPGLRLAGVPIVMWYAHGTVTSMLRRAHREVDAVVTSTPEGFRIPSDKVRVIGQGVDTALFSPQPLLARPGSVLVAGRVSRKKRIDRAIDAMSRLWARFPDVKSTLEIVGSPLTADDREYQRELEALAARCPWPAGITWHGHVDLERMPHIYQRSGLQLNLSETGSMDKTVIEALAVGCPVLTSNEALASMLSAHPDMVLSKAATPDEVAERIAGHLTAARPRPDLGLRGLVEGAHDLDSYAGRVFDVLRAVTRRRVETGAVR